jgi:hypothetical protein
MEPLRDAFKEECVDFEEWHLGSGGVVDLSSIPPEGVFYNRMSASSHTRGHRFAIEHTHAVLEWLELHGRRVINGSSALLLEGSKVRQYAALERSLIKTPRTIAVTGNYESRDPKAIQKLIAAAQEHFGNLPFISKHNRSGRGLGVRLWNDIKYFEKYLEDAFWHEVPVDGIMLLQQYIQSPQNNIIRCEFVDSKFLYAVQVNTSEGFELCPADHCSIIQNFKTNFEILKDFGTNPIIKDFERFITNQGIEICGIEFIVDQQGHFFTYDVNTNTNYNSAAEKRAFGMPWAMPAIARFLGKELSRVLERPERVKAKDVYVNEPVHIEGEKNQQELQTAKNWMTSFLSVLSRTFSDTTLSISS